MSSFGKAVKVEMHTRFLIVDDSELVRRSLRSVLQANPEWEIVGEAGDGAAAIEMFRELRPNIVILDFQMPGINGIETARRMAEIAPSIPIVLFTQHASTDLERHAKQVGIRSVVSKTNAFPMVGTIETLLAAPRTGTDGDGFAETPASGKG